MFRGGGAVVVCYVDAHGISTSFRYLTLKWV